MKISIQKGRSFLTGTAHAQVKLELLDSGFD